VAKLCRRRDLRYERRSAASGGVRPDIQVYLGDTMGELGLMYAASDIAFVGGSLVRAGGHNILEPCALGVPVLFGPYMHNFLLISEMVVERRAGVQVSGVPELVEAVDGYLSDANLRFTTGENGRKMVRENRGALQKTLNALSELGISSDLNGE
jgi:3-deoxy-D-manno-octulosonic-acid transferase